MAAITKAFSKFAEPIWAWAAKRYQAAVGAELKKYGLRWDDLYDDLYDLDVAEALKRLPQAEVDARNQRLKRAMDLSMKHAMLPKELQAKQIPYEFYLQDQLAQIKAEREERSALGSEMPYNRQLP
eukprot:TRINITY_DN386_c0_g1_i2.p1 TRINITY_DN386_c0_g1~~TRINITY_DN386_c0_g1_i2.p1  ORF type:complete len:138 (-),score=22.73 TRINITY_DN386_c0_g1_i2:423-800(-)